jgi:hypothetical protein
MSYSPDKFLRPLTSSDRNIQILDDNGVITYTINPFSIIKLFSLNNLVQIDLRGGKIIKLPFQSDLDAKNALFAFQQMVHTLTLKIPFNISKDSENYIEGRLSGFTGGSGAGSQGFQGRQGFQGWQGFQGQQGFQGWQGLQGPQSTQGEQGFQGLDGLQGYQGLQGSGFTWRGAFGAGVFYNVNDIVSYNGSSYVLTCCEGSYLDPTSNLDRFATFSQVGSQGFQGWQGIDGTQGTQGLQGTQGNQGNQGFQGFQGNQGFQGAQGNQGFQGFQGNQGFQGVQGQAGGSTNLFKYSGNTGSNSGNPGAGFIIWSDVIQRNSATISISHLTKDDEDVDVILETLKISDRILVQDFNNSTNYQNFVITSTPSLIPNSHVILPVSLISATGNGYTNFDDGHELLVGVIVQGPPGPFGPQGTQGFQGFQGLQGDQGFQGLQGNQGWQGTGAQGPTGPPNIIDAKTFITLDSNSLITWTYSLGYNAKITLATNSSLNLVGAGNGDYGTLFITQDTVGGRWLSLDLSQNSFQFGTYSLTIAPNSIDIFSFVHDGNKAYWNIGKNFK